MGKIELDDIDWSKFKRADDLIPTGSTLLNLALSENPYGGWVAGSIVNIVGDSHAGKSFLAWQTLAEVSNSDLFSDYELIYDDCESAMHFNIEKLFGSRTKDRVYYDERTELVETCFYAMKEKLKGKSPIVYVVDSLDGLSSREETEKSEKEIGKRDYPDKPRILSEQLKQVASLVDNTKSLVMIISQTRQNIGVMFGPKKRRAGGDALRFYSTHEMWLAVGEHIRQKGRDVGIVARIKVSKNKLTGKQREVEVPILVDYGIDDVGSMIDWMIEEKFWQQQKKEKGKEENKSPIDTLSDFGVSMTRDKLIEYFDDVPRLETLKEVVAECWMRVEGEIATKRRPRYERE